MEKGGRTSHIYLRDVRSSANPVRLTQGSIPESRPVWSPNGREIAYVRQIDSSHFEILRFDLASKTEQSVGQFITYWPIPEDHPALDWSRDGRFLLTAEQTSPETPVRIILIQLRTGERSFLTSPPVGSSGDIEAKFSPDSRWVAFRRGGLGDLYIVSVEGEQAQPATRLTFDTKGVRGIAWTDGGRSILFGAQRGPTIAFGLWKIPMAGGTPQALGPDDFDVINPAVSSNGKIVVEHRHVVTKLVERTLNLGGNPDKSTDAAERSLFPSGSIDSSPAYSPNGKSIAYISTRTGWGELWLYRIGQAAPIQLTHFEGKGFIFLLSWNPDGRSIAFSFRKDGATNILIYDLAGKMLRTLTSTRNRDVSPTYSSDGEFIYFSSNDDGTSRIWRIRANGSSRAEPLFVEATVGFLSSPDGRWLYFIRNGQQLTLLRRSLVDGVTEEIFHAPGHFTFADSLAMANHHLYLAVSQADPSDATIFRIEPDTKVVDMVAQLKNLPPFSFPAVPGFSVSPDGDRLVVGQTTLNETTLYIANLLSRG